MRARVAFAALAMLALLAACGGDDEEEAAATAGGESAADETSTEAAAPRAPLDGVAAVGTTLFFDAPRASVAEARERYEAECAGAATPACKQLQWRLELALYEDLRELGRNGALDDGLLRVAAAADSPQLKSFALERIQSRGLETNEHALVIATFDDPYPIVRGIAHVLARQLPDEKWVRMLERDAGVAADGVNGLIAGVEPSAARLGAPKYPGATHWHFASSAESGEFFTSGDDAEDVIAFYAKGGKPVLSTQEIEARLEQAKAAAQNPLLLMQKMQEVAEEGGDPQAMMAELTKGATSASADWGRDLDGRDDVQDLRFVVLAEEPLFGVPLPARVVAVFHDDAMGATGFVFRSKPLAAPPGIDLSTPEGMEGYLRVQQILAGSPID